MANTTQYVDVIVTVAGSQMRQVYKRLTDAQATEIMMKYAPMAGYTVSVMASKPREY